MFFWLREFVGWALVVASLVIVRIALGMVMDIDSPKIFEAGVLVLASLGILRAGILLIRISTAARIARLEPYTKSIVEKTVK